MEVLNDEQNELNLFYNKNNASLSNITSSINMKKNSISTTKNINRNNSKNYMHNNNNYKHNIKNLTSNNKIKVNIGISTKIKNEYSNKNRKLLKNSKLNPLKTKNTLIRILEKISLEDIQILQKNVNEIAHTYHYYKFNLSMETIPTSVHGFPNGDAIKNLESLLSMRKNAGIFNISKTCQV
jgi:hypothetical protein